MNNSINKKELKQLFDDDKVFSEITDEMKTKMLEAFPDGKTLDLDWVDGQRVGHDFLMYLIKDKKNEIVHKYYSSLLKYLIMLALLNNRRFIVQCDLMLLVKIKMDALGIDGWDNLINKEIKNTMFKKFEIELDRYGDLKEAMGIRMDDGKLTDQDYKNAKEAKAWLELVIPQVEANIPTALKTDQLQNIFYQDEITAKFKQDCSDLLSQMKYQLLAFNMVIDHENK